MTEKEFEELYKNEYANALKNAIKLLGGRYRDDAEDCVQEAFLKVWKHIDNVTTPAEAYLHRVLSNECKKLLELSRPHELCGSASEALLRAGRR
jgi:DNA-directed RNA polymerase specialized sigma24 family protein